MDKNNTIIRKSAGNNGSFISWITQYESLVVFGGFGIAVMAAIILTGIFQAGPPIRANVLYNAFGAFALAAIFIYMIFNFMGSNVVILGKTIDTGMIIYVAIVVFVIFVMGN